MTDNTNNINALKIIIAEKRVLMKYQNKTLFILLILNLTVSICLHEFRICGLIQLYSIFAVICIVTLVRPNYDVPYLFGDYADAELNDYVAKSMMQTNINGSICDNILKAYLILLFITILLFMHFV